MDKLPALKPLKLEGNLAENWRRWKQRYELFMTATNRGNICLRCTKITLVHESFCYFFIFCFFLTADIFASFGVLPLLHLRAYTLQDATAYTCSYLYSGNFIISTVKSRYSHCFNCLKLFNEDRQYPKNGRFWP